MVMDGVKILEVLLLHVMAVVLWRARRHSHCKPVHSVSNVELHTSSTQYPELRAQVLLAVDD